MIFRIDAASAVTVCTFSSGYVRSAGVIRRRWQPVRPTYGGRCSWHDRRLNLHARAPTVVATPAGIGTVTLRWAAVAGRHHIIRRTVPGQAPTVVARNVTTTSVMCRWRRRADASYTVTAVNADGEASPRRRCTCRGAPRCRARRRSDGARLRRRRQTDLTVYPSATEWFTARSPPTPASIHQAPRCSRSPGARRLRRRRQDRVAVYRETTGEWFIDRSSDNGAPPCLGRAGAG